MSALHFQEALLPDGWTRNVRIVLADGRIVSVAVDAEHQAADERHALGLPGMPNLHSHAFQRAMAGLTEMRGPSADSFWTWREQMYRFVERMSPEDVEAVAAQLYMEMLEEGFTRVGEFHYLHHGKDGRAYGNLAEMAAGIVSAASATGIGLTLLPVFYAHGGFGGQEPQPGQRRFLNNVAGYGALMDATRRLAAGLDGAIVGIAPHSLRAATPEELSGILSLAGDGPVHIHIAEQVAEVDACLAWSKARPVEWLLAHLPVNERWCLVHATHMNRDETKGVARSGAVVGLCPITEANLGDGIFNGPAFIEAGGLYGVGSDSNVLISLPGELRQLEYSQRLQHRARNVLAKVGSSSTGRSLFDTAVAGGGRALGVAETGLRAGAWADLVTLDTTRPALIGRTNDAILDSWIFASRERLVDCVWSRGRKVVSGGVHRARDGITARFQATLNRLLT